MKILERDLFNYIFFPECLNSDKLTYILANADNYKSELELLIGIKNQQKEKLSSEIIKSILFRVANLNRKSAVILEKTKKHTINSSEQLILAADSPNLEHKLRTDTFQDKNLNYLVKIITNEKENRIFVFSKESNELKNIQFIIQPSGHSFLVKSTSKPFIINPKEVINEIAIIPSS